VLLLVSCRPAPHAEVPLLTQAELASRPAAFQAAYNERIQQTATRPHRNAAEASLALFYHANGFLAEATTLYERLSKSEPREARWNYYLALIKQDFGATEEAIERLDRVIQLEPDYTLAIFRQAELFRKTGREVEAGSKYERCLELNAHQADAWLGLAQLAIRQDEWALAETQLLAAIEADAGMASAYKLLATTYEKLEQPEKSKQASELALYYGRQREPADPWYDAVNEHCFDGYRLTVLADSLLASGRTETAKAYLQRACQADPQSARARFDLAMLLGKDDQVQAERAVLLEQAVSLDPRFSDAYLELALIKVKRSDLEGALAIVAKGTEHDPNSPGLHRMKGRILERQRKYELAQGAFEHAIALNGNDADNHTALGNYYWARGQKIEAVACYTRAVELSMLAVEPRAMLATHLIEQADYDGAIRLLRAARSLESKVEGLDELLSLAWLRKGNAALRRNDFTNGEAALREALALKPDSIEAVNNLGALFHALGRLEEAAVLADRFIADNPRLTFGYQLLAGTKLKQRQTTAAIAALRQGLAVARAENDADAAREFAGRLAALGQQ
jgi:tetratricopeptide (TPR) repeat protein